MKRSRCWLASAWLLAVAIGCEATRFREVEATLTPAAAAPAPEPNADGRTPLRFSVAAVESPRDTYSAYSRLFGRVAERLDRSPEFVQRPTYAEVNDLLALGRVDVAFLCTGGWLELQRRAPSAAEVLAVPVVGGEASYRSLVIVPAASPARGMADLAGKRFAYTDELSLSGKSYVVRLLETMGQAPDRFFGIVTYTRSHDRSITAVARGIVDGAAVHSLVFAHMSARDPALAGRVRVIHRSPPFGGMPVVASLRLPPEVRRRLRQTLLDLPADPAGAAALGELGIERFAEPVSGIYDATVQWTEARR
ncbi:MAG TPA: phosphate/phosphite/phosphonate ABC transporter substrate-binding protein [Anaeromyxobacteraceae bacterium]|nr:phosphate/phosphite/phosphonate ABC transporter substrate-binding protein [Anaeromyxobacteraceae bacterium]